MKRTDTNVERFFACVGLLALALSVLALPLMGCGPPPPTGAERVALARIAVREGRLPDALNELQRAEQQSPGVDTQRLIDRVSEAIAVRDATARVKAALERENADQAEAALDLVRPVPLVVDERGALVAQVNQLRTKVDLKNFVAVLRDADAGVSVAEGLLPTLPADVRISADQLLVAMTQRWVAPSDLQAEGNELPIIERLFRRGQWEAAASLSALHARSAFGENFDPVGSENLSENILQFQQALEEGQAKYLAHQFKDAEPKLSHALTLLAQVGFGSDVKRPLSRWLAECLLVRAKATMRADRTSACELFREAHKYDPESVAAREGHWRCLGVRLKTDIVQVDGTDLDVGTSRLR